jgi:hypothetical protein
MRKTKFKTLAICLFWLLAITAYAQQTPNEVERAKIREAKIKANSAKTSAEPKQGVGEKTKYMEVQRKQQLQTQKGKVLESQNALKKSGSDRVDADKKAIKKTQSGAFSEKQAFIEKTKQLKPEDRKAYLLNQIEQNTKMTDEEKLAIKMELAQLEGKDISVLKKDQKPAKEQETKTVLPNLTQKDSRKVHYPEKENLDNPQDPKGLTPEQLREYHIQKKKEYLLKENQGKQE